jgi:hypothetical protein
LQLGGLDEVADIAARALMSQQAVATVTSAVPGGTYEVLRDLSTSGPILLVTADAKTSADTLATMKAVTDLVNPTLSELQSSLSVVTQAQITSSVLTADDHPDSVKKTTIRALIVALGIGLVGSALIVALVDSLLLTRRRQRPGQLEASSDALVVVKSHDGRGAESGTRSVTPRRRRQGSADDGVNGYPEQLLVPNDAAGHRRHRSATSSALGAAPHQVGEVEVGLVQHSTQLEVEASAAQRRRIVSPAPEREAPQTERPGARW